jgi:hypothetical protein
MLRHGPGQAAALCLFEVVGTFLVIVHAHQAPRLGAVPAASDLHDALTSREAAGEHGGVHGCQGPAGGEPDLLRTGPVTEHLGHPGLEGVREPRLEAESRAKGGRKGRGDHRWVVPQDVCVVALPEIEDGVPVLVHHAGAVGGRDPRRERLQQPDGVAAAVHEVAEGVAVEPRGTRRAPLVVRGQGGQEPVVLSWFHGPPQDNGNPRAAQEHPSLRIPGAL